MERGRDLDEFGHVEAALADFDFGEAGAMPAEALRELRLREVGVAARVATSTATTARCQGLRSDFNKKKKKTKTNTTNNTAVYESMMP